MNENDKLLKEAFKKGMRVKRMKSLKINSLDFLFGRMKKEKGKLDVKGESQ